MRAGVCTSVNGLHYLFIDRARRVCMVTTLMVGESIYNTTLRQMLRVEADQCIVYPCRLTCGHIEPVKVNSCRVTEECTLVIAIATRVPGHGVTQA